MPDLSKYNLQFRPDYWKDSETSNASRIKGEIRQQVAINKQDESGLSKLPYDFFNETLQQHRIIGYSVNGPEFLGGEHLPDFLDGEVEIARIIMFNANLDVTSIRTMKRKKEILLRATDEYETPFTCNPIRSKLPLSMEEMISFLHQLRSTYEPDKPLTNGFYYFNDTSWADSLEEIRDYIEVRSLFYPELNDWFKDEAQEAMMIHKMKPS